MPRYLMNTILVALLTVFCTILCASHSGYAAARFNFSGKKVILFLLLVNGDDSRDFNFSPPLLPGD